MGREAIGEAERCAAAARGGLRLRALHALDQALVERATVRYTTPAVELHERAQQIGPGIVRAQSLANDLGGLLQHRARLARQRVLERCAGERLGRRTSDLDPEVASGLRTGRIGRDDQDAKPFPPGAQGEGITRPGAGNRVLRMRIQIVGDGLASALVGHPYQHLIGQILASEVLRHADAVRLAVVELEVGEGLDEPHGGNIHRAHGGPRIGELDRRHQILVQGQVAIVLLEVGAARVLPAAVVDIVVEDEAQRVERRQRVSGLVRM